MEFNTVFKIYNTGDDEFYKIVDIAITMGLNGVGPRVVSYNYLNEQGILVLEKIPHHISTAELGFDEVIEEHFSKIDKDEFIKQVDSKIALMHKLGYAHGDLTLSNIVYRLDPFVVYIIDWDTAYIIDDGPDNPKVQYAMELIDWQGTYQEFIDNDYSYKDLIE